ncbi:Gldg family protein [Hyphomicrobium sp.]|uniref:GldG family protein n=1 Tax=Hyphomicrobium sp. TaxID=82 RepID=UPI002B75A767|nr:Gldg family protein [Hyphomicrobium sp.]HRN89351.1 Gldg family protein [Hyphomicrobium sp.]HRQ28045.1 Gldg family protein [Hyphomicrobium sp.]
MRDLLAAVRAHLSAMFSGLVTWASGLSAAKLAWGGLALAGVLLLSVNLISSTIFGNWKADLTEDRLYSISPGSVAVLQSMDEPITARVYFSRRLGELAPSHARYFERIRSMLEEFSRISGGKLQVEYLDPEPFSDAEDRAVASGLTGRRLNAEGEMGYFGLSATNSTDGHELIAFFSPDRENFVEYEITKLIHTLANAEKRRVGIISALPLDGGENPMTKQQTPAWGIMAQIREFFDVEKIAEDVIEIPNRIDVLLVAQPKGLTAQAAYAIDQYVLKGGKVLALIDPMPEASQFHLMQVPGEGRAELTKLLKAWGLEFDPTKVAADIRNARRVQFGRGSEGTVTEFVAWLGLSGDNINNQDVLSQGVDNLNLASSGYLTQVPGASTTITPILTTSTDAMEVSASHTGMGSNPLGLLRDYKPGGKSLTLAARVSGEAKSAFPNGQPKDETDLGTGAADEAKDGEKAEAAQPAATDPGPNHVASGQINAIVVADSDIMADQFWAETRQMMGRQFVIPHAHNAAFIVGALENLTGSDDLIALRGRGIKDRTFTRVESLRRDAERQYREKEQALTERLKSVEQELEKLQSAAAAGNVIVSDKEREAIEGFRNQMVETRRELRQVKLALRQNIDSLDGWLKFANIALVPLLIAVVGLGWTAWRSRRRPSPKP